MGRIGETAKHHRLTITNPELRLHRSRGDDRRVELRFGGGIADLLCHLELHETVGADGGTNGELGTDILVLDDLIQSSRIRGYRTRNLHEGPLATHDDLRLPIVLGDDHRATEDARIASRF